MRKLFLLLLVLLAVSFLLAADVTYVDTAGRGSPMIQPQVVAAVPAQPYACAIGVRGRMIYVDDTDDLAPGFVCVCVSTNDVAYGWVKVEDPTVSCF